MIKYLHLAMGFCLLVIFAIFIVMDIAPSNLFIGFLLAYSSFNSINRYYQIKNVEEEVENFLSQVQILKKVDLEKLTMEEDHELKQESQSERKH